MVGAVSRLVLLFVAVFFSAARAESSDSAVVIGASTQGNQAGKAIRLGSIITVDVAGMSSLPKAAVADKREIALMLSGIPFRGICLDAVALSNAPARFRFVLRRTDECRMEWAEMFGKPKPSTTILSNVPVAIQIGAGLSVHADPEDPVLLDIVVLPRSAWCVWPACFAVYIIVLFFLSKRSGMLRDWGPNPQSDQGKPFSLAMVQMAVWFSLVIPAFVFLWWITGGLLDIFNAQALTLIGIGAGTAALAKVQDDGKRSREKSTLEKRKNELAAVKRPTKAQEGELKSIKSSIDSRTKSAAVSEGFIKDILDDGTGISFHRFQMVIWTIVLGVVFVVEVWTNLAMPEFDATLLLLMGISSGTYLGFMLTEPAALDLSATTKATPKKPST